MEKNILNSLNHGAYVYNTQNREEPKEVQCRQGIRVLISITVFAS